MPEHLRIAGDDRPSAPPATTTIRSPLDVDDEWGDLVSFRTAAGAS
jgi:hypothetical protein